MNRSDRHYTSHLIIIMFKPPTRTSPPPSHSQLTYKVYMVTARNVSRRWLPPLVSRPYIWCRCRDVLAVLARVDDDLDGCSDFTSYWWHDCLCCYNISDVRVANTPPLFRKKIAPAIWVSNRRVVLRNLVNSSVTKSRWILIRDDYLLVDAPMWFLSPRLRYLSYVAELSPTGGILKKDVCHGASLVCPLSFGFVLPLVAQGVLRRCVSCTLANWTAAGGQWCDMRAAWGVGASVFPLNWKQLRGAMCMSRPASPWPAA